MLAIVNKSAMNMGGADMYSIPIVGFLDHIVALFSIFCFPLELYHFAFPPGCRVLIFLHLD
jgi:hypothetical protein